MAGLASGGDQDEHCLVLPNFCQDKTENCCLVKQLRIQSLHDTAFNANTLSSWYGDTKIVSWLLNQVADNLLFDIPIVGRSPNTHWGATTTLCLSLGVNATTGLHKRSFGWYSDT